MICEDKKTNDNWKNFCMIEFSIPDFNKTIIKNIISPFLSFSNTKRSEVVFRTQWFIGQYCSEREGSLAVLHFHFMTACYATDAR